MKDANEFRNGGISIEVAYARVSFWPALSEFTRPPRKAGIVCKLVKFGCGFFVCFASNIK